MAEKGGVYGLDEPTTGLHLADVEQLLGLRGRLVDSGKSFAIERSRGGGPPGRPRRSGFIPGISLSPAGVVNSASREHGALSPALSVPPGRANVGYACPQQRSTRICGTYAAKDRVREPENPGNPCKRRRSSAGRALHS
jgi:hypothetical protein